ncbi:MAG: copper chaperone PCu(A)C [Methyloligellaceae bacterium]
MAEEIYARPTIGQIANSAAYFTISNTAKEADTIISVGADIAKRVEIHTHKKEDGTMMMMKVEDPVVVPAGGKVLFKSGGLHVMLMGLKQKLKAGDSFPLTIRFKKNGTLTVKVIVKKPDIKKAMQDHSHH